MLPIAHYINERYRLILFSAAIDTYFTHDVDAAKTRLLLPTNFAAS